MSLRNSVIWSDGLFIKPHHFQQQLRYFEYIVRRRADAIHAYQYGFESLELNKENLLHGKISLVSASGIFPDRTVFEIPGETAPPVALDLSNVSLVNQVIYLALPLWVDGLSEIVTDSQTDEAARLTVLPQEVRDTSGADGESFIVDVGRLKLRLMLESEDRSSFSCIPMCKVQEKRADGAIVLDQGFMPMAYALEAIPQLKRILDDFTGLLQQRARQIATRLGELGQGGVAEVADFLLLQTINRLGPLFNHLRSINRVHPEWLYEVYAQAAGELATFTHESRMPEQWPAYTHEEPQFCFDPLVGSLRRSLSVMLVPNASALPLQKHKFGIITATLTEPSLLKNSVFVLAVKAAMPVDKLAKIFPSQVKISSIEKIRDLINLHLPGVTLQPMPTAPRQLPYHAGYTYFLLDSNSQGWVHLTNASGFAFHIAGEFPELDMQFWSIRDHKNGGLS